MAPGGLSTRARQLAYSLAIAYRETAQSKQPIRERGGEKYLRPKPCNPWGGRGAPAQSLQAPTQQPTREQYESSSY